MIDIEELRVLLKLEGVDLSDYSDKELNILIKSKSNELNGLLGLDVTPVHRRQFQTDFRNDILRLDFYPVKNVIDIHYNGEYLRHNNYHVNNDLGIVYFNERLNGDVEVKYLSGISDDTYYTLIIPLIKDMIAYSLTYNQSGSIEGVSSIKEGDVSINYDTSNSRGSRINNKINDIRNRYASARLRLL